MLAALDCPWMFLKTDGKFHFALQLIDLLGSENVKLNAEQLAEIMLILKKEKELDEEEKRIKKLQQQQTSTTTKTLSDAVSQETGKDPKQL